MASRDANIADRLLAGDKRALARAISFVENDDPRGWELVREVRGVLSLAPQRGWRVPIVKTEAARATGIDELVAKLDEHRAYIEAEGTLAERRRRNLRNEVLAIATARMRRRLEEELSEDADFQRLLEEVVERRLDPASAATTLLARAENARDAVE